MSTDSTEMTAAQRTEAKQYGRLSLYCGLLDKAIDLAFFAFFAAVITRPLDQWLGSAWTPATHATVRLVLLFLVMTLLHVVVSLPLSFYSGFLLEHRFKLSTLTAGGWAGRYLKMLGLGVALNLFLVMGLFWCIWLLGAWWWLAAGIGFFVVSVIIGQLLPVVIMPLFYKAQRLDAPELVERFRRLCEGTGLSIEGVYRLGLSVETVKANAMLAGLGRTRRVLLGDTLLDNFSPEEIEVILAHELGHHVHRHMPKMIVGGLVVSLLGLWLCDRLLALAAHGTPDYATLSPAMLPWLMLIMAVFGLAIGPLMNTVSRAMERQADRFSLERTGLVDAYRQAFAKLAKQNKDDPDPPRLEVILFHSHPPIAERIAAADKTNWGVRS